MKKLGIKRYVAVPKPYVDERARTMRIEYAQKHLVDDSDAWRISPAMFQFCGVSLTLTLRVCDDNRRENSTMLLYACTGVLHCCRIGPRGPPFRPAYLSSVLKYRQPLLYWLPA